MARTQPSSLQSVMSGETWLQCVDGRMRKGWEEEVDFGGRGQSYLRPFPPMEAAKRMTLVEWELKLSRLRHASSTKTNTHLTIRLVQRSWQIRTRDRALQALSSSWLRALSSTMSGKYAFTSTLREVRFHLCHSSPASEATRYVRPFLYSVLMVFEIASGPMLTGPSPLTDHS